MAPVLLLCPVSAWLPGSQGQGSSTSQAIRPQPAATASLLLAQLHMQQLLPLLLRWQTQSHLLLVLHSWMSSRSKPRSSTSTSSNRHSNGRLLMLMCRGMLLLLLLLLLLQLLLLLMQARPRALQSH